MSRPYLLAPLTALILATAFTAHGEEQTRRIYAPPVDMLTADAALEHEDTPLPPLPADVEQLRFREIYHMPVGPRGLEFSERTRVLAGQRVRVLGYMAREDQPVRGRLLLAPFPFTLFTGEFGHAEDLPPTLIHVHVPENADQRVPFTPGLLLLTGVLEIGPVEDPDGRVSAIRLRLDPPTTAESSPSLSANPSNP